MERWSSRFGFLAATTGAVVGPAAVWTFPLVVGQSGGGAYFLPFLLTAFAFAVPLVTLELSVGQTLHCDVVTAFSSIRPEFEALGWVVAAAAALVSSYYLVLTGWVCAFFVASLLGTPLGFDWFTGTYWPVLSFALATVATGGVVALGVRRGIERFATVAVPTAVLLLLALVAYATTLSGFDAGLSSFLAPDLAALSDPLVWATAAGHAFVSLSVGRGVILTYAQYFDGRTDAVSASVLVTVVAVAVGVLSGLLVFPVLVTSGVDATVGTELAFSTLPATLSGTPFGGVATAAFFAVLSLTALSSAVALFEVGVSAVLARSERSRSVVAGGVTAGIFVLGLPGALSYSAVSVTAFGVPVLDLVDTTVGTFSLPLTAVLVSVAFTWFQESLSVEAQVSVPSLRFLLRYAVPTVLAGAVGLHLWVRSGFLGWHLLPNARPPENAPEAVGVALVLTGLLLVGGALVAYRARRRAARRRS